MRTEREPRQERSRATRARLLEAAVACLAERGAPGTTVGAVAERAGVSRGAAQHHFQTREDLFVAAFDSMADGLIEGLRRLMEDLPEGPGRVEAMVVLLFDVFSGTEFQAALQLWTGAASDPDLHPRVVPLEQRVGREAHRTAVEVLGADESVPGVRETVQATLDLARGLGLANLLTDDTARRHRIARQWAVMLGRELGRGPDA
ncbi:TetR/AcrR family transcriptional regulator [Nocardiopsis kunsanensis]|uniref:TetR family transcriptional regulator n=1 Tax=Nocardiopsis kunsanensis TaxID=141693 RepID=A0A918XDW2_9ACTN|nr:TetR/AcrR family transcriptional regulator [Nocardiopsis kunsanensis]GHD27232.1 TetR family transcriptional regulator [Nocardiopsis kunsanensis]